MRTFLRTLFCLFISCNVYSQQFYYNQIGYFTEGAKFAVIDQTELTSFSLISTETGKKVFGGKIKPAEYWSQAGEKYSLLDFSDFKTEGTFFISVLDYGRSQVFEIAKNPYHKTLKAAVKAFYYNRAGMELTEEFAGKYARKAGHPDTSVKIHWSAADALRPEGTIFSSPKGWYDAGDYNKYIVNSGISTYELLLAYDNYKPLFDTLNLHIPESGNQTPDLLDEIKWNVDWMLTMQDPNDGGVYHKLTTENFSGHVMPHKAVEQRYFVRKSTAAAYNYSAVMSYIARLGVLGNSADYLKTSEKALAWAKANPDMKFKNPEGVNTGEYGDNSLGDEAFWAQKEYALANKKENDAKVDHVGAPSWNYVSTLGVISELSATGKSKSRDQLLKEADKLYAYYATNIFRVSMGYSNSDFVWGSNSSAANQGLILIQAYRTTKDKKYLQAASGLLDYLLGKNPTGYSYVTGHGHKTPMGIHHRPSVDDGIEQPVPGFLAGGPHNGKQDQCTGYPSNYNAKCYFDDVCSYSTNEVAINWNAPLVYLLAALEYYSLNGEL